LAPDGSNVAQDIWYLVYKDEDGVTHTVKGSTAGIRRSLRERLLGVATHVRASRTKDGTFEPLRGFPEFRDLVITPSPLNPVRTSATTPATPVQTPPQSKVVPTIPAQAATEPAAPAFEASHPFPHIRLETSTQSPVTTSEW